MLEAQSPDEPVLTEALSSEQDNMEPDKKMATHHRATDPAKDNLFELHEKVGVS
jgi:hypothetical protein